MRCALAPAHFLSANSIHRRRASSLPPSTPTRHRVPRLGSRWRRRSLVRRMSPRIPTPTPTTDLVEIAATAAASERTSRENYEPVKRDKLSSFLSSSTRFVSIPHSLVHSRTIHPSIDAHASDNQQPLSLSLSLSLDLMKSPMMAFGGAARRRLA